MEKNNFVFFLNENTKYKLNVKFNENKPDSCYYQVVRLPTKDIKYILPTSYYNSDKKNCEIENFEFSLENAIDKNTKKKEIALLFSIDDNKSHKYTVTISKIDKAMIIFLYVSIGLAGIFAVITFFLIRRKQSIDVKNEDNQEDLYNNEDNKEE